MKKLLFLFTTLLLISCSSEDEESVTTFLEKYDEYGFTDGDEYWFFFNDTIFLKYAEPTEFMCFEIKEGENRTFIAEIISNDSQKLLVNLTAPCSDCETESLQFTIDSTGNNLTVMYDGDSNDTDSYMKTSTKFASVCE